MVISSVLEGFQNQLDMLNWMSDTTKTGAYAKIKSLVRNIAYPDKILDKDWVWLTNYYARLSFGLDDKYLAILNSLNEFTTLIMFEVLQTNTGVVRDDFGSPPAIVNGMYSF